MTKEFITVKCRTKWSRAGFHTTLPSEWNQESVGTCKLPHSLLYFRPKTGSCLLYSTSCDNCKIFPDGILFCSDGKLKWVRKKVAAQIGKEKGRGSWSQTSSSCLPCLLPCSPFLPLALSTAVGQCPVSRLLTVRRKERLTDFKVEVERRKLGF